MQETRIKNHEVVVEARDEMREARDIVPSTKNQVGIRRLEARDEKLDSSLPCHVLILLDTYFIFFSRIRLPWSRDSRISKLPLNPGLNLYP